MSDVFDAWDVDAHGNRRIRKEEVTLPPIENVVLAANALAIVIAEAMDAEDVGTGPATEIAERYMVIQVGDSKRLEPPDRLAGKIREFVADEQGCRPWLTNLGSKADAIQARVIAALA